MSTLRVALAQVTTAADLPVEPAPALLAADLVTLVAGLLASP